jgi:predicted MFS family arabinose efflux permease
MLTTSATIVHVNTSPAILYGLEIILGLGAGAYTQASFAVIQAVVAPSEAANGLSLMLLGNICTGKSHLSLADG